MESVSYVFCSHTVWVWQLSTRKYHEEMMMKMKEYVPIREASLDKNKIKIRMKLRSKHLIIRNGFQRSKNLTICDQI
jgi:hypothetical protein